MPTLLVHVHKSVIPMPLSADEAHAVGYCLSCLLDNENDRGREGIGTSLMEQLQEIMIFLGEGFGTSIDIDLLRLALIERALDLYQEDPQVDQKIVEALLGRLVRALPCVIA